MTPQRIELVQNGNKSQHMVEHLLPSYSGALIQSVINVIKPANGAHSHHRIKWTRLPKTGPVTGNADHDDHGYYRNKLEHQTPDQYP